MKHLLYIVCMASLLGGCTKTIYVPVERTQTEYREIYARDSVYLQDSVYVKERGDTIRIERFRYVYRDKWLRDSVFINDTIRIPYPVEKVVYKGHGKTCLYTIGGVLLLFFWSIRRKR